MCYLKKKIDADLFKRFNELTVTFPSTSLKLIKSENLNNSTVKELLPFSPVLFHFIPVSVYHIYF